jgi:predicted metal-dependent phosphotriesterase family hydrolase
VPLVQTVLGPVADTELGRVMAHEHVFSLQPAAWAGTAVDAAVAALLPLREVGFGTVVDLSPYGVVGRDDDGHNVVALREVAERTGLHIVAGTAVYLESFAPAWVRDAGVDGLAARFVRDAATGIGSTDVRAGVLGEQATGLGAISAFEERALRAALRAQRETGLALFTHTTHGTMAHEQLDIAVSEGADLERIVVGHLDTQLSADLAQSLLDRGALIAVDTIGKQEWDFFLGPAGDRQAEGEFAKQAFHRADEGRADLVAGLVARGYADRIVLAQDLTGAECWMNPGTHGRFGYRYLADVFVPLLLARGVDDEHIETMLARTPARLLAVA